MLMLRQVTWWSSGASVYRGVNSGDGWQGAGGDGVDNAMRDDVIRVRVRV